MRKTLQDVARYLKDTLVPEADEAYAILPVYTAILPEEDIRKGVSAFRAFLVRLYGEVEAAGAAYDTCKKAAHAYENRTSLSVYYPFLHHVRIILMKIGYYGRFGESAGALCCENVFTRKITVGKNLECLRFLTSCGLRFDGIDLNDKKQGLHDTRSITVTCPDNPAMLAGLKIMAVAEADHGTLTNQDVFLRCDYRALQQKETDPLTIVRETMRHLPADMQAFALDLHRRYVDKGLTCTVEVKGFHTYIKYSFKRKDVWGLNASLSNGCHINVKSTKTDEYYDEIQTFAPFLQSLIAKGYGCGRKREIGRCDGGCRGMPIPLDASVLEMKDDIVRWFDLEVSCLQEK